MTRCASLQGFTANPNWLQTWEFWKAKYGKYLDFFYSWDEESRLCLPVKARGQQNPKKEKGKGKKLTTQAQPAKRKKKHKSELCVSFSSLERTPPSLYPFPNDKEGSSWRWCECCACILPVSSFLPHWQPLKQTGWMPGQLSHIPHIKTAQVDCMELIRSECQQW